MSESDPLWTEQESLFWDDPREFIRRLDVAAVEPSRIFILSKRRWLLFFVACLRRVEHVFRDNRTRKMLDAVEGYADGLISEEDLDRIGFQTIPPSVVPPNLDNLTDVPLDSCSNEQSAIWYAWDALKAAVWAACEGGCPLTEAAEGITFSCACSYSCARGLEWDSPQRELELARQATLFRDIIGNPFLRVILDSAWLRWRDETIAKIAQSIYDNREFSDLPILADALEEAGCTDSGILNHCRGEVTHVRGCWVLDLVLGKS